MSHHPCQKPDVATRSGVTRPVVASGLMKSVAYRPIAM